MQKELIIATTSQETKIAILEDDELVEYYIERHRSQGIVGNIYKGRVTKVLPGMQSAFVDIGLERDAFLYVSDFLEDTEEYEKIVSTVEDEVTAHLQETPVRQEPPVRPIIIPAPLPVPLAVPFETPSVEAVIPLVDSLEGQDGPGTPESALQDDADRRGRRRERDGDRNRDRGRGGKKPPRIPSFESKTYEPRIEPRTEPRSEPRAEIRTDDRTFGSIQALPGESLSKYKTLASRAAASESAIQAEGGGSAGHEGAVADGAPSASSGTSPEAAQSNNAENRVAAFGIMSDRPTSTETSGPAGVAGKNPEDKPEDKPGGKARDEQQDAGARSPKSGESSKYKTLASRAAASDAAAEAEGGENVGHEGAVADEAPSAGAAGEPAKSGNAENRVAAFEVMSERPTSTEIAGPAVEHPQDNGADKAEDEPQDASARITDQSRKNQFAHRPAGGGRPRRRGPGPGPGRPGGPGGPNGPGGPGGPGGGASPRIEERPMSGPAPKGTLTIAELLREGQEILVQVSKEPLGKKGARITSHIALPGRYLVYMPTVDHVGVSRKIGSDEERTRLKRIINENRNGLPGGFIVRTAAEGRGEHEFIQDIRFLGNLWSDTRFKAEKKSAPTMIHRDLNLVQRILRDQLSSDFTAIRLDNEQEFATVLDFVNKFQPALVNRVKLHLKDTPILEEYGLHLEIDKALRSKVWMKSGGYIVINQTEALVAIDVNTGKFVGKSNRLEDTIVKTNLDAVHEIVRQIRLRNLGGIIVVDFIDMEEKKNRQRVMTALEDAIRSDRVPSKILQFNDFGLVAITRKRTQPSLERTICSPCGHCNGTGWTKSLETICYDIQQEIKKMSPLLEGKEITVRVNPEVAKVLKSGEFVSLNDLEAWTKRDVIVKSDPLLHEEHFDIF